MENCSGFMGASEAMVIRALWETIAAFSKNHMKFINARCGQKVRPGNVTARGI
jgi:hypothetical protein